MSPHPPPEMEILKRFVNSKDHLSRNIASIEFESVAYDGTDGCGTFEHSVQVKIAVLRRNLWQGARAYIFKHLGSDVWERGNGTTIAFSRIHEK